MQNIDLAIEIQEILQGSINPLTAEQILQYQNRQNGTIDLILNLCQAYINYINMELAQFSKNQYGIKYVTGVTKKNNKYTWAQLNTYGARIIYLIRYLLHEEGISFLFGVSNGKIVKQALVSQFDIMTNMEKVGRSSIGIKITQLENYLKTISNTEYTNKRLNQWNEVLQLGTVERYNDLKEKEIKAHKIYQSTKEDNQVWVKFSGKNKNRSYYYDLNNNGDENNFIFYNVGWLYQWYNAILKGEDEEKYNSVVAGLQNNTIAPIIGEKERVAGTKSGDFTDAQNQQIQVKYNNEKIISYNNIKVIIIELTTALLAWKNSNYSNETQQKLRSVLQEHFYPDSILVGNDTANTAFEQVISTLKSGLSQSLRLT